MAETKLGFVTVKLFAQVGDGDQYEIGWVNVPLTAKVHGRGLVVDLDTPFEAVAELVKQTFQTAEGSR